MYGMLSTENNTTRDKIFAMTPEIGNSFWPEASSIETICKNIIYHNITAAKMIIIFSIKNLTFTQSWIQKSIIS